MVWAELQRQLDAMGLRVKRGTIQDATFIEEYLGSSKKPHDSGTAEMEPGLRKVRKAILAIIFIKKTISITA